MKRRRDRDFWIKLFDEAEKRQYNLTRKVAYLEGMLKKYPLHPCARRVGRMRLSTSRGRRVSFAKFRLIHRVRSTSLKKTRRLLAKTERQLVHYRVMIDQCNQRSNAWWRLLHPLV